MEDKFSFRKSLRIKILLGFVTVLAIAFMFPKGESIESDVAVGSIWIHDDLIAPFSFPVIKDKIIYREELKSAEKSIYPIYLNKKKSIVDSLNSYNLYLIRIIDETINSDTIELNNPTFLSTESFNEFLELRKREINLLQDKAFSHKTLFNKVETILNMAAERGILSESTGSDSIAAREGNVDKIESSGEYFTVNEAREKIIEEIDKANYNTGIKKALKEYALHFVFPNLLYSAEQTNEEIEQVRNNVSKYTGIVNENERIIAKHDRVTKEAKLKIDSYKIAKGEKTGDEGFFLQILGNFLHIASLITLITIYLFLFRKNIFYDNQKYC